MSGEEAAAGAVTPASARGGALAQAPTPMSTPAPRRVRYEGLDVLKGIAIILVVFNHSVLWPMRSGDRASAFAYGIAFGTVAAFSAVAGYLQGRHPAREEAVVVRKRAGQLLVPWLVWAPLYVLVPLAWGWIGGGTLPIGMDPWPWAREILLGGGPLWFLTGLFAVTAVCALLDTRTSSWWPAWAAFGGYAALTIACSFLNVSPLELGRGTFWAVVPLYVGAFWFGLRVARDGDPGWPAAVLWAVVVASMIAGGVVTSLRALEETLRWLMWLPYAIGSLGGCAALLLAVRDRRESGGRALGPLARIGRSSLGLYVLHPVLVAPAALLASGRGGVIAGAAITAGVVAIGTPLVELARRVPVLARIV